MKLFFGSSFFFVALYSYKGQIKARFTVTDLFADDTVVNGEGATPHRLLILIIIGLWFRLIVNFILANSLKLIRLI